MRPAQIPIRRIGFIQDLYPKSAADGSDANDSNYLRPVPWWRGGVSFDPTDYFKPRTTGMSNSRIFLRNVLRLRPSRCAALIWLPRVAPRVNRIKGHSTSRNT